MEAFTYIFENALMSIQVFMAKVFLYRHHSIDFRMVLFILLALFTLHSPCPAVANCCHCPTNHVTVNCHWAPHVFNPASLECDAFMGCYDDTPCSPHCGLQSDSCNVFGCDCVGGCKLAKDRQLEGRLLEGRSSEIEKVKRQKFPKSKFPPNNYKK